MINKNYTPFTAQGELQDALSCYRYNQEDLVVVQLTEQMAQTFLDGSEHGIGTDGSAVWNEKWLQDKRNLMQSLSCHFLLLIWKEQEERLLFLSDSMRVRPLEFLDYILDGGSGLMHGDSYCACAQVSRIILTIQVSDLDMRETTEYLLEKVSSYFTDCNCIDAVEYGKQHKEEIQGLPRYCKKRLAWAYVKSTDITKEGGQLKIKSLENESGYVVGAKDDLYIMIGCRGEIYDISRKKFEQTYEATDEPLDVFEKMMDYFPELKKLPEQKYISLDEYAHICYPKQNAQIHVKRLDKRVKIFPADGSGEYFLGRPGDYMAIRTDDLTDIYVIEDGIFAQTYSLSEQSSDI